MFSYYGSKSKVVKYYPEPMCDTIIEPFAGSARYSLHGDNWKRNVILVDKYDVIVAIWKYLIQTTPKRILSLPEAVKGMNVKKMIGLCEEESLLMGYCINRGSSHPKNAPGDFCSWESDKVRIANDLYKIKHWKVVQGDYHCIGNGNSTYFIDPPYQFGGDRYKHSNKYFDFQELNRWCLSRKGQVIVCENTKATWMDFTPLKSMHGSKHTTTEAMWTNMPQVEQLPLE